jgi:hypothetical protein
MGQVRNGYKFVVGNLKGREKFGVVGVYERIILLKTDIK